MNLGKALRLSLKEKQISQSELAKRLGISRELSINIYTVGNMGKLQH